MVGRLDFGVGEAERSCCRDSSEGQGQNLQSHFLEVSATFDHLLINVAQELWEAKANTFKGLSVQHAEILKQIAR